MVGDRFYKRYERFKELKNDYEKFKPKYHISIKRFNKEKYKYHADYVERENPLEKKIK